MSSARSSFHKYFEKGLFEFHCQVWVFQIVICASLLLKEPDYAQAGMAHTRAPHLQTKRNQLFMLCSSGKGRAESANQSLPAQQKLPADFLLLHPAWTNRQMPSITSLFLLTWVYKNLSSCTAHQRPFLLDWRLPNSWILNKCLLDK